MGWLNHFQGLQVWGEWKAWHWRDGEKIRREEEWQNGWEPGSRGKWAKICLVIKMMANVIACIFSKTKGFIEGSCIQNRQVNWCHQNSEFLAMISCLQWLPPYLKLTLHAFLRKRDLVSPVSQVSGMLPLQEPWKPPCPDL